MRTVVASWGSRTRSAGAGEQERRPLPRGGLHGQGLGQLACERVRASVCEPVPLAPRRDPRLYLPLLACGGHLCDLLWPEGVGASVPPSPPLPPALAACVCLTAFGLQATTKEVKDSLGKQWSQLSDKKRLKWIHKALEQRKEYEVRLPLHSSPSGSSRASAL